MNGETAYIGIDPGQGKNNPGAAALIVDDGFIAFYDWNDENTAEKVIRHWGDNYDIEGISIEKVWSRPNDGHRNASLLLENYGFWKGVARIICQPALYAPKEWQQVLINLPIGKFPNKRGKIDTKRRSVAAARYLFPGIKDIVYLKKHSGRSDALLIGEYGKQIDAIRRGQDRFKKQH